MHLLINGITGHRGNSRRFPENSIAAFRSAIDCGVDFIELDIRYTGDRQLVVIHDEDTEALTGTKCVVAETSLNELKRLNTAYRYNLPPCHLATLQEVFQALGAGCPAGISIQPKLTFQDGCQAIEETIQLAQSMNMSKLIAFNDGQLELMKHVKEVNPSIPVFYDSSQGSDQEIQDAIQYGFETIVNFKDTTTKQWVEKVKTANLIPGVWNISNLDEFQRFKEMGIQRFYADNAEEILTL